MPITFNGSGTVTGIVAGGLPDGVITTSDLADNSVTYAKVGTTEQSQLCKAWVNFDGIGTVSIRTSYNVSSITDNGIGDYAVNFTNSLVDTDYVTIGLGYGAGTDRANIIKQVGSASDLTKTTSSVGFQVFRGGSSTTIDDVNSCCVLVFR